MRKVNLIVILSVLFLTSCGQKERSAEEIGQNDRDSLLELPLPSIPENIDSTQIARYLLEHFWDALDFADTLRTRNRDFMEQNFANFSQLLILADDSTAERTGIRTLMKKAEADTLTYKTISEIAYHYLYDPNSPLLDEESYIPFMEIFKDSQFLGEAERERNRFLLQGAMKNRPGMRAADFKYTDRAGRAGTLYKTPVEGDLMVIFYDPDCDNCKEIMDKLAHNPSLSEMINQGKLTLLAVYSGENKDLWEKTAPELPKEWIVGYNDGSIEDNEDYLFRASPTIYLLDSEKNVLVKDLPSAQIF